MATKKHEHENSSNSSNLGQDVREGEELAELLKASVAPPPPDELEDRDDDGRLTFTPLQQAQISLGLASYAPPPPPPRRRTGPFLVGLTVMTSVVVLAFGAFAWWGRPPQATAPMDREANNAAAELEQRDLELIALRAAHQQSIAKLEARIHDLEKSEAPGAEESLAELEVKLEEVRAESFQLEAEAVALDDRRRKRSSSARKGSPGGSEVSAAEGIGSGELDDNPYDGVTSATNLNNTVWAKGEAEEPAPKTPAPGKSSVDDLIESAVKGPSHAKSKEAAADQTHVNTLPGAGQASLPVKPPRSAVQQVMGSMLSEIRRCGGEPYERLVVQLTVSGSTGRVTGSRTVDKNYAGTPVGACAAKAVRLARFPKFQKERVVIKYPFDL